MAAPGGAGPPPADMKYQLFFDDAGHDPFGGDYAEAMAPYLVPLANNNATAPATVRNLACNCASNNVPTAFLLLHPDNLLHVYVQLSPFNARMGMPTTPWDGNMYIQKGDLHHNQAVLVEWQDNYFHQVQNQIRVPTAAAIDTTLAGDANLQVLGPYNDQDADTELIRVRRTCYVPPAYVSLFLANPLTPRQAWDRVRGQIVVDNREGPCTALVDYLRAALTISQQNQAPLLTLQDAPTAPVADADLLDHRRRILESDFPNLNQHLAGLQQTEIAQSINTYINDERDRAEQQRLDKERDRLRTLSDLIGEEGIVKVCRLANVPNQAGLPTIWAALAGAKKSQRISQLQHAVDQEVAICQEGPELQFIITPPILTLVLERQFHMQTLDSIGTGLQPFMFPRLDEQLAVSNVTAFQAIYSGASAPSTADIQALVGAKVGAPKTILHCRHMIRRVEILCKVLFGRTHALPVALERFANRLFSFEATLDNVVTAQPRYLLGTIILRKVALQLNHYFQTFRTTNAVVNVPNFNQFFDDVEIDNPWESIVPVSIRSQLGFPLGNLPHYGPPAAPSPAPTPAPAPRGAPGNAPAPAPSGGAPQRTRIANMNFNSMFQRYRDMTAVRCSAIRKKVEAGTLPALPVSKVDGEAMCLAWHVKGECNSACGRRADHVKYASEEYTPLATWCETNFHAE